MGTRLPVMSMAYSACSYSVLFIRKCNLHLYLLRIHRDLWERWVIKRCVAKVWICETFPPEMCDLRGSVAKLMCTCAMWGWVSRSFPLQYLNTHITLCSDPFSSHSFPTRVSRLHSSFVYYCYVQNLVQLSFFPIQRHCSRSEKWSTCYCFIISSCTAWLSYTSL